MTDVHEHGHGHDHGHEHGHAVGSTRTEPWHLWPARMCLLWPFAVLTGLEIALRVALWQDRGRRTSELLVPFPASWSCDHWFGYVYLGLLQGWLAVGVALAVVSLALVRDQRLRALILTGAALDLGIMCFASLIRY